MSADEEEDQKLRIMVVDDRQFQRRLIAETLRAVRDLVIDYAEGAEECLLLLGNVRPDLLIIDWDIEGGKGLDLVRRVRKGDAGAEVRATPIVMVSTHNTERAVQEARSAGVDEFVLRPFSTAILTRRAKEVRDSKREFVESVHFVGPCRRRRKEPDYDGPRRRHVRQPGKDGRQSGPANPQGLARMYAERIAVLLRSSRRRSRRLARYLPRVRPAQRFGQRMKDKLLMSAASSLFSYVKGCGGTAKSMSGSCRRIWTRLSSWPNCPILNTSCDRP